MEPTRMTPEQEVTIETGGVQLMGALGVPEGARGVVLFAHGSGSSRFSVRNRFVASELQAEGLATLLMDLLTPPEEQIDQVTRELRFDIPMLAQRLTGAVDWLGAQPQTDGLPIGCFGASTGAAAAMIAAANRPERVAAVVSRGGRPDLASEALKRVQAPTLLLVGQYDPIVIRLNQQAMDEMPCEKELTIIPGATHLFEEPGTLEQVAEFAAAWFRAWFSKGRRKSEAA